MWLHVARVGAVFESEDQMNTQSDYWEPESLVAALVVGAKVRVRGFAECPFALQMHQPLYKRAHPYCHQERMVGREGVILAAYTEGAKGHHWFVGFDPGEWGHYAAIELEAVED